MRHRQSKYKLNRSTSWRKATIRSLARSILLNERIKTTIHKAKAARHGVENLISLAKMNTLAARRRAASMLNNDHQLVNRLFKEIGPRFNERLSGFTRIINLGARRGDNAQMVIFELTEIKEKLPKKLKKTLKSEQPVEEKLPIGEEVISEEKKPEEKRPKKGKTIVKEQKPKRFLGGIRNIFKKERDSL